MIADVLSSLGSAAELLKTLIERRTRSSSERALARLESLATQEGNRKLRVQLAFLSVSEAESKMQLARMETQTAATLGINLMNLAILLDMASRTESTENGDSEETEALIEDLFSSGLGAVKAAQDRYGVEKTISAETFRSRMASLKALMASER